MELFFIYFHLYPYTPTHNHPKDTAFIPYNQIKRVTICHEGYELRYMRAFLDFIAIMTKT